MPAGDETPKSRGATAQPAAPKDMWRLQLIEATIATMSTRGYARTTLSEVARHAERRMVW